jgi:hypothetical protein
MPDTATETATGVINEPRDPAEAAPGEWGAQVQGRSLRQIAWSRLKRDRVAIVGGLIVIFLVLVAASRPDRRAARPSAGPVPGTRSIPTSAACAKAPGVV